MVLSIVSMPAIVSARLHWSPWIRFKFVVTIKKTSTEVMIQNAFKPLPPSISLETIIRWLRRSQAAQPGTTADILHTLKQILEEEERFSKNFVSRICQFFWRPEFLQTWRSSGHLRRAVNTFEMYQFAEAIKHHKKPGSNGSLNFSGSSGMPFVKSWLIALIVLLNMVICQSQKN